MKNSLDRYVDKIFNKYYNYLKYNHVIFLLISFLYFLIFKNILDISDNNIYLKIFRYFLIIFYFSSLAPFVTTFNAFSKRGEIIRLLYCLFRYIYIYPVYVINSETPYDLYYSDFYYLFLMGIAVGGVLEYIFVSVYIKKYQVIGICQQKCRLFLFKITSPGFPQIFKFLEPHLSGFFILAFFITSFLLLKIFSASPLLT